MLRIAVLAALLLPEDFATYLEAAAHRD